MKYIYTIALALLSINLIAQIDNSAIKNTKDLSFMIGTWKGEGWILGKDRKIKKFSQSEKIQPKADNSALMVDGIGYAIDGNGKITDKIIHNAFGVISFNNERKHITMLAFSKVSGRMESNLIPLGTINEKKIQWTYVDSKRGFKVRFTEDFSDKNLWIEIGEIWIQNKWSKFFEMKLKKVN